MALQQADKPASRTPKTTLRKKTAARRPGRPSGSVNKVEQRNRLLGAAMKLFARQGIAETTLSAIAREAGVTPAMVHYYFKSRDQLLDVLIDERIQPQRLAIGEAFKVDVDDPVKVITNLAEQLMHTATHHPWFPALWMREVISDNGILRERIHKRHGKPQYQAVIDVLARWQKQGRINPDIEPSLLFVSIFGLIVLPLVASKSWNNDPAKQKLTPEDIARHAVALLTRGVSPPN
ncbi:TetR/AcrR family transcriptional regulator [Dyella sp. 2HG41-7]|uniref:TetR/AcrR family transcriptional regulator n=1 Tax=Dyella sp. 2HG41-7 TaxID=2883239 RepID=UPI001F264FB9|nr:TetR/AcrR family transcriptional regulator [Dyella sp. 2HG41-7]